MRISIISLVWCACVWAAGADNSHIKVVKSRILGRLAGKHHKRGILSAVPPFKLGHDIPYVTHSVLKPLVVTYPPTASVAAVKIPVSGPHFPRYPVPVGHKVPGLPHPHYGLKFPQHKLVANPDHHFHHHHHHVAPRPLVPVVNAAPVIPAPPPTVALVNAAPAPPSPVPVFPAQLPVPAPPVPVIPGHLHLKSYTPGTVPFPASAVLPAPLLPLNQAFPFIIRPGGAVQTSFLSTYLRNPFLNSYQAPLIPLPATPALSAPQPELFERTPLHPYHLVPQTAAAHGVVPQHTPNIVVEQPQVHFHSTELAPQPHVHLHPTQEAPPHPGFHLHSTEAIPQAIPLQPTQPSVSVEHDGWSPVTSGHHQDGATSHDTQYPQLHHHFTQEQGTQVYEHHSENQYPDYQHQLHHIQQQIEQAQYEQSLHHQHHQHHQQQQPDAEYGAPQPLGQDYGQPNEYSQHGQELAQQGHDFAQHTQDFAQHAHDFGQHGQDFSQHGQDFSQNGQNFNQNTYNVGHLGQEYGVPHQGVEGRSSEVSADQQQYHNHIPLGLQPPIDRPLDHFQ